MHRVAHSSSFSRLRNGQGALSTSRVLSRRPAHALAKVRAAPTQYAQVQPVKLQIADNLSYSDEELAEFYHNLLSASQPEPTPASSAPSIASPTSINSVPTHDDIAALESRFSPQYPEAFPFSTLQSMGYSYSLLNSMARQKRFDNLYPYQRLLLQITNVLAQTESVHSDSFPTAAVTAGSSSGATRRWASPVPLALLSYKEWFDVVSHCIAVGDMSATQHVLTLMAKSGLRPPANLYSNVLKSVSQNARVEEVEAFIELMKEQSIAISQDIMHEHTRAYVRSRRLEDACTVLHAYESAFEAHPPSLSSSLAPVLPSQKTYTLVLSSLIARDQPHSRALAWDLFAHMRYVAHPIPDATAYATMIRACSQASNPESQVVRALDLWTEMRVDNGIQPGREGYNAIIRACARASGRDTTGQTHAAEAFRIAREMLDAFRSGAGHLKPNAETFGALLESVKRTGDLNRARWILAESVGAYEADTSSRELAPNEDVMAQLFQVYASYQPPSALIRRDVRTQSVAEGTDASDIKTAASTSSSIRPSSSKFSAANRVPQSHAEVIAEASLLFSRIIADQDPSTRSPTSTFAHVRLSTHLLNSYLSVHFAHSSIASSREVCDALFSLPPTPNGEIVKKNARTYLLALQRCARTSSVKQYGVEETRESWAFARQVWKEWRESGLENVGGTNPRTVEKIWSAIVRVETLAENIDGAMDLVREFGQRYPPRSLAPPSAPIDEDSSTIPSSGPSHGRDAREVNYRTHPRTLLMNPNPISSTTSSRTPIVSPLSSPSLSSSSSSSDPSSSTPESHLQSQPHPLVSLVSPTLLPTASLPPFFTFSDVSVLHARLLVAQRWKDVGYIKWLTSAYGGALRRKREGVLEALGGKMRSKEEKMGMGTEVRTRREDGRGEGARGRR